MKKNQNISQYRGKDRFEQALSEKNLRLSKLDRTKSKLEKELEGVKQFLKERDAQLQTLAQTIQDKDMRIANLNEAVAASSGQVELLTQAINERDSIIQQLQISTSEFGHWLAQMRNSLGWKLLKPIRVAANLLSHIKGQLNVDLVPLAGVHRKGMQWISMDEPIQFLLIARQAWQRLPGWYWLDIESEMEKSTTMHFFFNLGQGFDTSQGISFSLSGKGRQAIPLFVPVDCRAIRLNLNDISEIFKLNIVALTTSTAEILLNESFSQQLVAYEALGGQQGNGGALTPLNAIRRHENNDYCWCSETEDPSFELRNLNVKMRQGWYLIELVIRLDTDNGHAKLYFDFGSGYRAGTGNLNRQISGGSATFDCLTGRGNGAEDVKKNETDALSGVQSKSGVSGLGGRQDAGRTGAAI